MKTLWPRKNRSYLFDSSCSSWFSVLLASLLLCQSNFSASSSVLSLFYTVGGRRRIRPPPRHFRDHFGCFSSAKIGSEAWRNSVYFEHAWLVSDTIAKLKIDFIRQLNPKRSYIRRIFGLKIKSFSPSRRRLFCWPKWFHRIDTCVPHQKVECTLGNLRRSIH